MPPSTSLQRLSLCLILGLGAPAAHAAGTETNTPPTPSPTTTQCEEGKIWDAPTETCVDARDSRLDDDTLYDAAREMAYAGRYDYAGTALDSMSDQQDTRVLTYRGFIARQTGDWSAAQAFYDAALIASPDNILARAYMGMGLLQNGDRDAADVQLAEIRARGGVGTWPEQALETALLGGQIFDY